MFDDDYLKKFPKPEWAIGQTIRTDRNDMVEDICEHGCGHPNTEWLASKYNAGGPSIHGCCGCCTPSKEKEDKRTFRFYTTSNFNFTLSTTDDLIEKAIDLTEQGKDYLVNYSSTGGKPRLIFLKNIAIIDEE